MAENVIKCSKIAAVKTAELTELMNQSLEDHWTSRKRKRDRVTPVGTIPDIPSSTPPTISSTPTPTPTPTSSSSFSTTSTPTPKSFTAVTPTSIPSIPKSTPPKQPQESVVPTKKAKKLDEFTPSPMDVTDTSNKASFPNAAAKAEFEDFASSLSTQTKETKNKTARKKAKIDSDSEEEEIVVLKAAEATSLPQKETQPKPSTKPKPNLDTGAAKSVKIETVAEGKNDTVMRDVLDSWGAEGDEIAAEPAKNKPPPKKEESITRRGADTDGKKKRIKEIISIDD